jgi:molecular chaperone DnaK (HSP70)
MKGSEEVVAVGIDYGTTSSLAAVAGAQRPLHLVPIPQKPDGPTLDYLPGYLYFPSTRRVIVGEVARRFFTLKPHKVIRSVKRDLSRSWTIGRTSYSAADLIRYVLREVLAATRARLPHPVRSAVLTVPSTFGQQERRTLIDSARGASRWLREVTLLDEPLAAFLAYLDEARRGFCRAPPARGRVLVFDMGGGTTDISVLEVRGDGRGAWGARVLGVWSDTRLGGDDFDTALAGHLAAQWMSLCHSSRGPLTESERRYAGGKMLAAAERVKIDLGISEEPAEVRVDRLPSGPELATHVDLASYRTTVDALLGRVREALRHGLERSGTASGQVDAVVLAGGMGRTRIVRQEVESFFGRPPVTLEDPMTAVVRGACLHHMSLVGSSPPVLLESLRPVMSHTLGLRLARSRFLPILEAGTELPASRTLHGCLLTPHTGCAAVRVPLYTDGESGQRRLLATLTLSSKRVMPGGQPVGIELEADINKLIQVRAFLEDGSSVERRLEVTGL